MKTSIKYYLNITIGIGTLHFNESIPLRCSNQDSKDHPHEIILNGHDTKLESARQQYWCKIYFKKK